VSDPLSKATRYRERAEECLALATMAGDDHIRLHYEQLAETYLSLAMAELSGSAQATSIAALKRAAEVTDIESE
jgi:hypothetical protein